MVEVEDVKMSTYESLGQDMGDDNEGDSINLADKNRRRSLKGRCNTAFQSVSHRLSSRKVIKSLLFGQGLSILLSGTGVFSGLLQEQGVNVPTGQSFPMYFILCLVFATQLAYRKDEAGDTEGGEEEESGQGDKRSFLSLLRHDGWKYALLGIIDVEANYLVVKAYAYTTVTSVQLLDCFSIASVLVLSRIFLGTKYRVCHYAGVVVSLIGLGGLIWADVISGKNDNEGGGTRPVVGDILVISGAILYGFSNVGQEFVVKNYDKSEFLGMIGLFGSLVSGIQMMVIEREEVVKVDFTSYKVVLPLIGFVIFLLLIYTCMSYVIQQTSATLTNISILSADFYSLIVGIFIFKYSFHYLYFIAFVVVIVGVAIYSIRPTQAESTPAMSHDDVDST